MGYWAAICAILLLGFLASQSWAQTAQNAQSAPMRIVSLMPALTETVCDLGACDRLVGVDDYSDYPAQVQRLPKLGGLGSTRIEAIVRLRPDLVLAPQSIRVTDRLRALGLRVLVLEPQNTRQTQEAYLQIGQAIGLSQAQTRQKWTRLEQEVLNLAKQVPPALTGRSVYFEVSTAPYAAGEASFIGELIQTLGLRNAVPRELGAFPLLNTEFIIRQQPDIMITVQSNAKAGGSRAMQILRRKGTPVCTLSKAQGDAMVRPGPRMPQAAQALLACLSKLHGVAAPTKG